MRTFIRPVLSPFFVFILIGYLSKWLLCSAVAIGETSLMMMTGSLKQAKHSALPRGLISRTNLPLIRLRLFVHLVLFLLFSFFVLFAMQPSVVSWSSPLRNPVPLHPPDWFQNR